MKHIKTILTLCSVLFVSMLSIAQVDRSQMPIPGNAPKIEMGDTYEFELKNGLKVIVVENHKLPRVRASLTIDNPPMSFGEKVGVESMLSSMFMKGTKNRTKDDFNSRTEYLGATMGIYSSGAYVSSLSKYFPEILSLMAEGALQPVFPQEEYDAEVQKMLDGLKADENSADAAADRVRRLIDYGNNHPYAEYETEETITNLSLEDVNSYYNKYYKPNHAYLVIVGDVQGKKVKKLVKNLFGKWEASDHLHFDPMPGVPTVEQSKVQLVNMPNATQSVINISYPVEMDMNNPDYFPVLIASKILGGNFNSRLNMNLREQHGWTYGARGGIRPDRYVGRFFASAKVRNEVTDSAVYEALREIDTILMEPVSKKELDIAKAKFVGDFVLALEKPSTVADYALRIKTNKLPEDFYKTYLENIKSVSIEDISRVSKKYFTPQKANIHVTGKGSEIAEPLKQLGYPVNYYDKWGDAIKDPSVKADVGDVSSSTIIDKAIKALGGKQKLETIKTIHAVHDMKMDMLPMPASSTSISALPHQTMMKIEMPGMGVLFKSVFDGENGYQEQMGAGKSDMDKEQINEMKSTNPIFSELSLRASDYTVDNIEDVNGSKAYKLVENDKSTQLFFDVDSGLLVRKISKTPGDGPPVEITFSDYKNHDGIMIPGKFHMNAGQQMIFELKSVEFNKPVDASVFQ